MKKYKSTFTLITIVLSLSMLALSFNTKSLQTTKLPSSAEDTTIHSQQPGIKRTDLQQHNLSIPGREVIQVRVDIAPGYASSKHTHPGEEIVYVIEGTLEYEVEDKPPVTLKAGDVLFIPAGAIHLARNVGKDNGAELATYIVEKGKPLVEIVK
ncbi:MAG: cupin domain-containing protein [bacterium]